MMGEGGVFVDYGQWRWRRRMTGLRPINALAFSPNMSTQAFCRREIRILSR